MLLDGLRLRLTAHLCALQNPLATRHRSPTLSGLERGQGIGRRPSNIFAEVGVFVVPKQNGFLPAERLSNRVAPPGCEGDASVPQRWSLPEDEGVLVLSLEGDAVARDRVTGLQRRA